jgi:hypothetical protein
VDLVRVEEEGLEALRVLEVVVDREEGDDLDRKGWEGGEHLSFLQMFGFYDFERCLMPVPLLVASCNPLARRRCWRDRRKARREKVDVRRKQKEPFVSSFPFGTSLEAIPGRLAG